VDRDKVMKQGIDLTSVFRTLQAFMGGAFINYFNRFGRVWQVYIQARAITGATTEQSRPVNYRPQPQGQNVPLSACVTMVPTNGPEITIRFNEFLSAQLIGTLNPGYSSAQV
jgi:HAE1 family hydrophobic/amphiphilic exporter-1